MFVWYKRREGRKNHNETLVLLTKKIIIVSMTTLTTDVKSDLSSTLSEIYCFNAQPGRRQFKECKQKVECWKLTDKVNVEHIS